MRYLEYTKPAKTSQEIIDFLKYNNLKFKDEIEAKTILNNINYFRFKIYLYPFYEKDTKTYKSNSYFEDGYKIYCFDEELRELLFSSIAKIELLIRNRLNALALKATNNPFWYLDNLYFKNSYQIDSIRNKILSDFTNLYTDYSRNFQDKYINNTKNSNYKSLPPFWIVMEFITFGTLKKIFTNIENDKISINRKCIKNLLAEEFGFHNRAEFLTILGILNKVRNICAHHSRLYNIIFPNISGNFYLHHLNNNPNIQNKRKLLTTFMILHIISKQNNLIFDIDIKKEIDELLSKYSSINAKELGLDDDLFKNNSFWN